MGLPQEGGGKRARRGYCLGDSSRKPGNWDALSILSRQSKPRLGKGEKTPFEGKKGDQPLKGPRDPRESDFLQRRFLVERNSSSRGC